jgi:hypothetical protein
VVGHTHCGQRFRYPFVDLGRWVTHVQRPEGNVLKDCRREKLIVRILEDEAYPGTHGTHRSVVYRQTGDLYLATAAHAKRAIQVQKQSRLACPVWPNDGHLFAWNHFQVDVDQRLAAIWVDKGQVFYMDDWFQQGSPASC